MDGECVGAAARRRGSPAPGMAPSRPYDGCHGAGDGPPPQRAAGGGVHAGLPPEPESQVRAATVGHVAAGDGFPTLGMTSLAGAAGEVADAGTLALLTRQAVEDKRKGRRRRRGWRTRAVGAAPSG